nr:MAG: hypothetical protein [Porcellio scaber clopovirus]
MEANVEINIYGVRYNEGEKFHSVLEFATPITLISLETKEKKEISDLTNGDFIKFKPEGCIRPLITFNLRKNKETLTNLFSLEEYLYFNVDPNTLEESMEMNLVEMSGKNYPLRITCTKYNTCDDFKLLANKIFYRWRDHISKRYHDHKENETVTRIEKGKLKETIRVMTEMVKTGYQSQMNKITDSKSENTVIQTKLLNYDLKKYAYECLRITSSTFRIYNKDSEKEIIENTSLAKFVMRSSRDLLNKKYEIIRGKYEESFEENDKLEFSNALENVMRSLNEISNLESVIQECYQDSNCTILDLNDPFLPMLLKREKLAFLKCFTVTGIPIIAEITWASQQNPWSLQAKLTEDYEDWFPLYCHITIDLSLDKHLFIKEDEKEKISSFNAIVPVFSPDFLKVFKPILQTNIFASLCTYSILKNPNVVHRDAHFAALMCIWIKLIKVEKKQSNHVCAKLICIRSTAETYLDLPFFKSYKNELVNSPKRVLRKDGNNDDDDEDTTPSEFFSENLIKPIFIIMHYRGEMSNEKQIEIVTLLVREFIDRMVSTFKEHYSLIDIFLNLFVSGLKSNSTKRRRIGENLLYTKDVSTCFDNSHKKECFTSIMTGLREYFENNYNIQELSYSIALNEDILYNFVNENAIGDFNLRNLKYIAIKYLCFSKDVVDQIFDTKMLFLYVYESLSRDEDICKIHNIDVYKYAHYWVETKIKTEINKLAMKEKAPVTTTTTAATATTTTTSTTTTTKTAKRPIAINFF